MLLISQETADRIVEWGSSWGWLDVVADETEGLAIVAGFSRKEEIKYPVSTEWMKRHYLAHADKRENAGTWYRVKPELHEMHEVLSRQQLDLRLEGFRDAVPSGWRSPPQGRTMPVLALSEEGGEPRWTCWWVSSEGATPGLLHVFEESADVFATLAPSWPLSDLAEALVTVVGVGSIGSALIETLASYGLRRFCLVDPDRLLQHNVVRHRLNDSDIGRYKVSAMREKLLKRYPLLEIETLPIDVLYEADILRPVIDQSTVVVGTTDGVAPRRVVNHLAWRARRALVLGCVLENGSIGEVLRVRPGAPCLLCQRQHLQDEGSMDPEPSLDLGYGTGTRHLPMTAVGGDLSLVADLAAKATVATILESKGHWAQRLPGEQALVALRPVPDLPEPFDFEFAGDIRWSPGWNHQSECPTCSER